MAITEESQLELLAALEDALRALDKAKSMAESAAQRAHVDPGLAGNELAQLGVMIDPALLLDNALGTMLAAKSARAHWSESRLRANAKRRKQRERKEIEG